MSAALDRSLAPLARAFGGEAYAGGRRALIPAPPDEPISFGVGEAPSADSGAAAEDRH